MPRTAPPAGWSPSARAPRLRRAATVLEARADAIDAPRVANRIRRIARDMRIRASEIELGNQLEDEFEQFREMQIAR